MLKLTLDPEADAAYLYLGPLATVQRTEAIDESRALDLDAAGRVLGVELLNVSQGVDLAGLPEGGRLREALEAEGVRVVQPG